MSRNIDQVYTANPITSNASTDLMYFGQSPYGAGDDAAMTYGNFAAQFTNQLTSPAQALFVANDGDDTTGTGVIEKPFATYEKARSVAVLSASSTTPYLIIALGIFNITGDMTLSPFVYISGWNINAAVFNVTGSVVLDALFDTTANANTALQDLELNAATGINLTFNTFQGARVSFTNILIYGTPSIVVVGSGTNSSGEVVVLDSLFNESGSSTTSLTATNIILSLLDSRVGGPVTSINNSSITTSLFFVDNLDSLGGNLTIQTTNTSTQTAIITGSNLYESVLTIDGVQNTLIIDSTSYATTPVYLSGASAANIVLTSLSDGVEANTNFTPINYTPTAGTNFKSDSVTGNLQGIDNVLGTLVSAVNWIAAATTSITATVNTGYYITDASQVTITLPTTAAAGSIVSIAGSGAGGWILAPGSAQTIKVIGSSASTSITSAEQYDCIEVICVVANTTWVTRSCMTTGFTIS